MRFHARTDANHKTIINELRKCGFSVVSLHQIGKGCPDLLVGKNGMTYLIEVKTEKGTLTDDQKKFLDEWRGGRVFVVRTLEEFLKAY